MSFHHSVSSTQAKATQKTFTSSKQEEEELARAELKLIEENVYKVKLMNVIILRLRSTCMCINRRKGVNSIRNQERNGKLIFFSLSSLHIPKQAYCSFIPPSL